MAARDPRTGQFISFEMAEDIEAVTWDVTVAIPSSETGLTDNERFQGIDIYDLDSIIDRNEEAVMMMAAHRMVVNYIDMDATAPTEVGRSGWFAEISTAASLQVDTVTYIGGDPGTDLDGLTGSFDAASNVNVDDSLDLLGRPLVVESQQVVRDAVDAVGAGPDLGSDEYQGGVADPSFFPRDSIFLNLTGWLDNVDDPGWLVQVHGHHIFEIRED